MSQLTASFRPRVLFIGNDASSPEIAASLLHRLVGDVVDIGTAGTQTLEPGGRSDEMLVAMGLDPAQEQSLSTRALHTADRVVMLGTDLDVARLPGPRYEEWDLVHEDLADRVQALGDDLTKAHLPARRTLRQRWRALVRTDR